MKILLVEDDPETRISMCYLLQRRYGVDVAENGYAALERLPGEYDLLITDLLMPGMSGLDLICSSGEKGYSNPAILMSASRDSDARDYLQARRVEWNEFFDGKTNKFLGKPVRPDVLLREIESYDVL